METTLFTVGHSTRNGPEFVDLLRNHGVERLVDVRQFPGSRRLPHFGATQLSAELAAAGIGYEHVPDLGGRRRPRADSENTYWRHPSFQAFADYMATPEFARGLAHLMELARQNPTVIMCAEAVPWRCHRQLISDALVDRGIHVRHILGTHRLEDHHLNPRARRQEGGHLIYRAEESQGRLFAGP